MNTQTESKDHQNCALHHFAAKNIVDCHTDAETCTLQADIVKTDALHHSAAKDIVDCHTDSETCTLKADNVRTDALHHSAAKDIAEFHHHLWRHEQWQQISSKLHTALLRSEEHRWIPKESSTCRKLRADDVRIDLSQRFARDRALKPCLGGMLSELMCDITLQKTAHFYAMHKSTWDNTTQKLI